MKRLFFFLTSLLFLSAPLYAVVTDKILATVNGEPVTLSELERLLQPIYKQYEHMYNGEQLDEYKKRARIELLNQLIENKIILQKAKKEGVGVSEASMEEELANTKEKFGSMEEFQRAIEKEGMTMDQFKKDLTEQLTVRGMIERDVVPRAKVTPEDIENYYNEHKVEFVKPEMVHIGHILIKEDERKAQNIYKQLGEGKDFSKLAEECSEAGDPGYIPINKLKPELRDIVDSLQVGQYSQIIKTDIGFHIIKLLDKKPPEELKVSEVWDDIENKLFREKLSKAHKDWVEGLKAKAHIVIEQP